MKRLFRIEIWFRYRGADEKDYFIEDIEAEDEESAHKIARTLRRNIFNTYTII